MKKQISLILSLFIAVCAYAQNTYNIAAGTQLVTSGNLHLVVGDGNFINNGTYTDAAGTFVLSGNVIENGSGITSLNDMTINTGASIDIAGIIHVAGAVSNNGTLTAGNGTVDYNAPGDQNISPLAYGNLTISNTGNKTLTGNTDVNINLTVSGTSKLITGINLLTLKGSASTITGADFGTAAGSWIVTGNGGTGALNTGLGGLVIENIGAAGRSGAVTFPIGPTTTLYNPVQLTNTGVTDNFTANVNDQPVPGAVPATSINATWIIGEATAGGTVATLNTQWNGSQESGSFVRTDAVVVHSNGSVIDYHGASGAASGSDPYTLDGAGFTVFSPFGVTTTNTILPVSWYSFNAQKQNSNVLLQWQTASEMNSAGFNVQHSTDAINYITIGTVSAAGNSRFINNYYFRDNAPTKGNNYYRLQLLNRDGNISYSVIKQVAFTGQPGTFTIISNPVTHGLLQVQLYTANVMALYSNDGKLVYKQQLAAGVQYIHLGTLAKGIYLLQAGTQTQKIVLQ